MTSSDSASALTFHETQLDHVEHTSGIWLRGSQIASALGYSDSRRGVAELFERNAAEFTDSMTALVKLPTAGGLQEVRIFSLRGAHLLGMFARTDHAAEFRRWVLDVLDQQAAPSGPPLPPPVAAHQVLQTLQRVTTERDTLRQLLADRMLAEDPKLRKVLYYYGVQGLTHTERARLMGWKTTAEWFKRLKLLATLGLVDYEPDPRFSAVGKLNFQRQQAQRRALAGDKPPQHPSRARPGRSMPPEHMQRMRDSRKPKAPVGGNQEGGAQ